VIRNYIILELCYGLLTSQKEKMYINLTEKKEAFDNLHLLIKLKKIVIVSYIISEL
jgi:hypothetical protein